MAHRYRFLGEMVDGENLVRNVLNPSIAPPQTIVAMDRHQEEISSGGVAKNSGDQPFEIPRRWRLPQDECHHELKTLRLPPHTEVEVTNGQGLWSIGKLEVMGKNTCEVEVCFPPAEGGPKDPLTENNLLHEYLGGGIYREIMSPRTLHILLGALRPGEVDELLPTFTELGVFSISIFAQKGTPTWSQKASVLERWERILRQALKQCKRAYLPHISLAPSVDQALEELGQKYALDLTTVGKRVLSETSLWSLWEDLTPHSLESHQILACGSERGLHRDEFESLENQGFRPVCLGGGILRAKTAVLLGAGIFSVAMNRR